ncbi:MAG: isocitrate lyase/PEP mutase family protein, partial [Chloroflexota bacterium]
MRTTTRLRQLLKAPGIVVAPGAYDCLTARIIQQAGFPAVYMTGAGTSIARLGYPDLALATMTEMVANAAAIAASVEVPLIADADTGYGGVLNVQRTVRQYERAGVAALHIEDQEFPKRCGHLDNKRVIPVQDMVRKVRAAVDARTDPDFVIIVRTD